jgi:hypothetical protein
MQLGSILKQTKRKHQLKACIKYVDKKFPVMRPNLQPKIYKSPVKSHFAAGALGDSIYVLAFLWFINSILELSP